MALLVGLMVAGLLLVAAPLTALVGVVGLTGDLLGLRDDTRLREEGRTLPAVVARVRETTYVDPDGVRYAPTVRYTHDGRTTTVVLRDDSVGEPGVYREGQEVEVMVDPAHPEQPRLRSERVRDELTSSARAHGAAATLGTAVTVPLAVLAVRAGRRQEARRREHVARRAVERVAEREQEEAREREREQRRGRPS